MVSSSLLLGGDAPVCGFSGTIALSAHRTAALHGHGAAEPSEVMRPGRAGRPTTGLPSGTGMGFWVSIDGFERRVEACRKKVRRRVKTQWPRLLEAGTTT